MGKREPWKMVCSCGAEFFTACYTTFFCPECTKRRKKESQMRCNHTEKGRERQRRAQARKRERNPELLNERTRIWRAKNRDEINAKKRQKYAENHEEILYETRLRYHARRGNITAKLELAKRNGRLLYCERMKVSALSLPCGSREECWGGKPCPKTAGMKRPSGMMRWE